MRRSRGLGDVYKRQQEDKEEIMPLLYKLLLTVVILL
jgi:hypothetical protein